MPREGVPYPERLLCSVRCELKNIWNALNGKLHSVNGVEGDGQGDVKIVSGDAAVVVTPQPLSNQVEISLDQSQLPAAAVTSVNNATGAVHLIGADIRTGVYSSGNSATQDISTARAAITGVNQNVTAEATARQNADSALQTNINAVTASLPGLASAAVANSPVVQNLVYEDSRNLKIPDINQYAVGLTGNQSNIAGLKDFNYPPRHDFKGILGSGGYWYKIWESEESVAAVWRSTIVEVVIRNDSKYARFCIGRRILSQNECLTVYGNFADNTVIFTRDANGKCTLWTSYVRFSAWIVFDGRANTIDQNTDSTTIPDTTGYAQPQASDYSVFFYVN